MFLQNEQEKNVIQKPIPTIEIPDFADFNITDKARMIKGESLIELQNLELSSLEVSSVSSCESDSITIIEAETKTPPSKLKRARQPKLSSCITSEVGGAHAQTTGGNVTETCLSTVDERSEPKSDCSRGSHSGIVLSPSKLGQ